MLKFELSEQMVKVIASILAQAPYNVVAPVLAELQKQIDAQQIMPSINGKDEVGLRQ